MTTINFTNDDFVTPEEFFDFLTDEEFFDALEAFRGPDITFTYTPEQDAAYDEWLAKRKAKRAKPLTEAERREAAKAKVMAFYTEENILNERSLWED